MDKPLRPDLMNDMESHVQLAEALENRLRNLNHRLEDTLFGLDTANKDTGRPVRAGRTFRDKLDREFDAVQAIEGELNHLDSIVERIGDVADRVPTEGPGVDYPRAARDATSPEPGRGYRVR